MAQENLAGRTVAGYHLLEPVGEGGTAMVYRAEHGEHGRCAVKILKPRLRTDENARKRFLRESEYGARVEHQGVVQTFDSQLAGALGAAHASGIIHRDLKPENIVYDPNTQIVKLLDFGIARDAQADPAQRLTRTGFFVGTLQYVAPEALSGELVGSEADIFSLATITYYLLTDLHPFDGRSPRELFQQLLTADARPLNQAAKGLKFSNELEKAVMAGLAREPSKRPATVEKFAQGLALAAAGDGDGGGGKSGILGVFKSIIGRQ
jgi:serine/threonine-protein kinase